MFRQRNQRVSFPLSNYSSGAGRIGLPQHLAFTGLSALALTVLFMLSRLALLLYNRELASTIPASELLASFGVGFRFDLRLIVVGIAPLILAMPSLWLMQRRGLFVAWLTLYSSINLLLGISELDFYREFHQRLNSIAFQYFQEDMGTVLSMLWHGFPVGRYLAGWALSTWLIWRFYRLLDLNTRTHALASPRRHAWLQRLAVFALCLVSAVVAARGTLRQGPPLRWGDAFHSEHVFANHLALNGSLTLTWAALQQTSEHGKVRWASKMPESEALQRLRARWITPQDQLVDAGEAPLRRIFTPAQAQVLPGVKNVVVILMESFNGHFVGAMGSRDEITPNFDRLAEEGLLFTHFFSNGTHTHQGMFATMGCFPNLPGFEYLMRQPEGGHHFSGLPQLLKSRGLEDVYVYNGNFQWDNQKGFFANQGMSRFVGREDFVNPVFIDPTWGVSDQDMFDRSLEELRRFDGKPFYALLQTLSNHTPYALPTQLPVSAVTGHGDLDQHLTAMRYADWALGQFFEKVRKEPYYKDTLFVLLGDHGFGTGEQITDMDLIRHNVPLLLIGPGVREHFGARDEHIGSQIDVVPTIMGRLGQPVQHQCWGRDLLNLPPGDPGVAVIKPSGNDQTVGLVEGDRILVQPVGAPARLFQFKLGGAPAASIIEDSAAQKRMGADLDAFISSATRGLERNIVGVGQPH